MTIKLIVIDDDTAVTDLLSLLLKSQGFEVLATNNSSDGLNMIREVQPDLVILDLMMPEMDGYETTKAIRASDQPWKNITIIALTADAMVGDKEKCFQAGMDGYVTKPFKIEEIQEILRAKMLLV